MRSETFVGRCDTKLAPRAYATRGILISSRSSCLTEPSESWLTSRISGRSLASPRGDEYTLSSQRPRMIRRHSRR